MLRPGDVVIDGGANVGAVTKVCAEAVGSTGRVIAVEPDHRCWDALSSLAQSYPQIDVRHDAIWGKRTAIDFYLAQNPPRSSAIPRAVDTIAETVRVGTVSLDDLTDNHVAAVKLDLQGAEPQALMGTHRLIDQCSKWVIEIWPFAWRGNEANEWGPLSLLRAYDLQPYWMGEKLVKASYQELFEFCEQTIVEHQHVNVVFTR